MDKNLIADMIPVIIVIAIVGAVLVVSYLMGRKAEIVCRDLVNNHFHELRLLNDCSVFSGFIPDKGILALLPDRMVFVSALFNKRLEIPLTEITKIVVPRFSLPNKNQSRPFTLELAGKKIKMSMNQFTFNAWRTALEKSAPTLAAQKLAAPIK